VQKHVFEAHRSGLQLAQGRRPASTTTRASSFAHVSPRRSDTTRHAANRLADREPIDARHAARRRSSSAPSPWTTISNLAARAPATRRASYPACRPRTRRPCVMINTSGRWQVTSGRMWLESITVCFLSQRVISARVSRVEQVEPGVGSSEDQYLGQDDRLGEPTRWRRPRESVRSPRAAPARPHFSTASSTRARRLRGRHASSGTSCRGSRDAHPL